MPEIEASVQILLERTARLVEDVGILRELSQGDHDLLIKHDGLLERHSVKIKRLDETKADKSAVDILVSRLSAAVNVKPPVPRTVFEAVINATPMVATALGIIWLVAKYQGFL